MLQTEERPQVFINNEITYFNQKDREKSGSGLKEGLTGYRYL